VIALFPHDYKGAFKSVGKSRDEKGLWHYDLEAIKDETVCPFCGGTNIHRNGSYPKKGFKDITGEGNTVVLSFKLWRYICDDCTAKKSAEDGKKTYVTFPTRLPDCAPEDDKVSTDLIDKLVEKIATEHKSSTAAAKDCCISQGTASAQLAVRRQKAEACIQSWYPADAIIIYPFNYPVDNSIGSKSTETKECCAVFGVIDESVLLYTILDSFADEAVLNLLRRIPFDGDNPPYLLLTDYPRELLHCEIPQIYDGIDLAIERTCTFEIMNQILEANTDDKAIARELLALKNIFAAHYHDPIADEFMPLDLDSAFTKYGIILDEFEESLPWYGKYNTKESVQDTFECMYKTWKANCKTVDALSELCTKIENNMEKIANGFLYCRDTYDPAQLLKFVKYSKHNHIPLQDLWSWLALIADVHNKEKVSAVQMLTNSFVPRPIHRFGIDLVKLNRLLTEDAEKAPV